MRIKKIIVDKIPEKNTDCPFCLNEREYVGDSYTCDMNDDGVCDKTKCPLVTEGTNMEERIKILEEQIKILEDKIDSLESVISLLKSVTKANSSTIVDLVKIIKNL